MKAKPWLIVLALALSLTAVGLQAQDTLDKGVTADCPGDVVGGTASAVEVGTEIAKTYCFEINYGGDTPVLVRDTLPAEWGFVASEDLNSNPLFVGQANKKGNQKSATKIGWLLNLTPPIDESIVIQAETRCKGNRNNSKCAPTSCGALYLNDGAEAYEVDEFGVPLVDEFGELLPPVATSAGICLAAVEDLDGGGIVPDGSGDEDGDGYSDQEEACVYGTNPCLFDDADGDGIHDLEDACPFDPDNDADGDGLCGDVDPCPLDPDPACV